MAGSAARRGGGRRDRRAGRRARPCRAGPRRDGARARGQRRAARCARSRSAARPSTPGRPCSRCAGCSRSCSQPSGARLDDAPHARAGRRSWPGTPGATDERLDLLRRRGALGRCDRRLRRRRPRPRATSTSAQRARGIYRDAGTALHARIAAPARCRPGCARRRCAGSATCGGSRPSRRCGARSAATSTIRACGSCSAATPPIAARRRSRRPATLMLVAHVEQDGRVAGRGRHASARRSAGASWRRARGATLPLSAPRSRAILVDGGARRRRAPGRRRDARRPTPSSSMAMSARSRGGCFGDERCAAAVPRPATRHGRCRPLTWSLSRARRRLSAAAPQRVLLRDYRREFDDIFATRPAAGGADRLCLRAGPRRRGGARGRRRRSGCCCLVNAPAERRRATLHARGDRSDAQTARFGAWQRCGLQVAARREARIA